MDPLVNSIKIALTSSNAFYYTAYDFEFFNSISKHPRLTLKSIIPMYDLLQSVYLTDIVFAPLSAGPLLNLLNLHLYDKEV